MSLAKQCDNKSSSVRTNKTCCNDYQMNQTNTYPVDPQCRSKHTLNLQQDSVELACLVDFYVKIYAVCSVNVAFCSLHTYCTYIHTVLLHCQQLNLVTHFYLTFRHVIADVEFSFYISILIISCSERNQQSCVKA